MSKPLDRLKHHVTGAIERGEKSAIVAERDALREALHRLEIAATKATTAVLPGTDMAAWLETRNAIDQARQALALSKGGGE